MKIQTARYEWMFIAKWIGGTTSTEHGIILDIGYQKIIAERHKPRDW